MHAHRLNNVYIGRTDEVGLDQVVGESSSGVVLFGGGTIVLAVGAPVGYIPLAGDLVGLLRILGKVAVVDEGVAEDEETGRSESSRRSRRVVRGRVRAVTDWVRCPNNISRPVTTIRKFRRRTTPYRTTLHANSCEIKVYVRSKTLATNRHHR
jgi:hypothetical protein